MLLLLSFPGKATVWKKIGAKRLYQILSPAILSFLRNAKADVWTVENKTQQSP